KGDRHRKLEPGERFPESIARSRRRDSDHLTQPRLDDHADRDRLAVKQLEARERLDGMSDRVTEVQDLPRSRLPLVRSDHIRFDLTDRAIRCTIAAGSSARIESADSSIQSKYSESAMAPCFTASARPLISSLRGNVRSVSV